MLKSIIKRICTSIPTILVLVTISFFLVWLVPDSPFTGKRNLSPVVMANIEAEYHLNDPMCLQYFHCLKQLAQRDLEPSSRYKDFSVNESLIQSLSVSAELGFYAFLTVAIFGAFIDVIAALKQNSWLGYVLTSGAMIGIVVPSFVMVPILVLVSVVRLQWLFAGGWNGGALINLILPVTTLSIGYISGITRITRGAMIEMLNNPFIRMTRAKGLPMSRIVLRHALRPAILPIVSFLGPTFVGITTGFIVTENVFDIPGVEQLFINGALSHDYGMILDLTILTGIMTIPFNAILDIPYIIIDSKIHY